MASMNFDEDGLLDEPCLSCDEAYVEDIWYGWCCDEKECPYKTEKEVQDINNQMKFPETFEEFAKDHVFKDDLGLELIPMFRVRQWLEHEKDESLVDRIDAEIAKRLEVHKGGNMREIYIVSTTDNQWQKAVLLTKEQAKAIEWFIKESHIDYYMVKVSNIIEEVE